MNEGPLRLPRYSRPTHSAITVLIITTCGVHIVSLSWRLRYSCVETGRAIILRAGQATTHPTTIHLIDLAWLQLVSMATRSHQEEEEEENT